MRRLFFIACIAIFFNSIFAAEDPTWSTFYGNLAAQKYSPLTQINPDNVKDLQVAWVAHTGDVSDGQHQLPPTVWSATPLFVNNTVYVGTPFYRIFALDPATGKTKWVFDPHAVLKALTQPALKTRGVAYWQAAKIIPGLSCQKRVYIGTMDGKLYAVDADTGQACRDFGKDGMIDINQWNSRPDEWPLSILQPPTVYKNLLLLGWAGKDWAYEKDPAGNLLALDAQTGKLVWVFNPIPKDVVKQTGTANIWTGMAVDTQKDILYIPVSSPSPNFWGGNRLEPLPYVTSVTALNVNTGSVIWSRQLVHHDLWDYDTDSAPTLIDIQKDGKRIPALVQTSKQGYLYILNRYTGEPIYPIHEEPVPASDVPGEKSSPTQPEVPYPVPVIPNHWPGINQLADKVSFGYCTRRFNQLRYEGKFTPPSTQGSLAYPGTIGGVEWGGGAVDPAKQIFVVNTSSVANIMTLIPRKDYNSMLQTHGINEQSDSYFPQTGAPYGIHLEPFLNPYGMPCWNPPYGSLIAYNLITGEVLWNKPFGVVQKWGFYMPKSWGSVTIGAPVITGGKLIFIGASMDPRVRAIDLETGKVLWQANVAAPAVSIPAVYEYNGKEYVVFIAGGNNILTPRVSDQVIAFALPD